MRRAFWQKGMFQSLVPYGSVPEIDGALYAVGDVHGRLDLLEQLTDRILRDSLELERKGDERPMLVFVGDVIDRGPDSAGVLEFLSAVRDWPEFDTVFVVGNHELMLLEFLSDPIKGRRWIRHGGYETLLSYGLRRLGDPNDPDDLRALARQLRAIMGPHLDLITEMVPCLRWGNVLVTHAGADPQIPAEAQPAQVLAWGCEGFHRARRKDGVWVVYGHEIVHQPQLRNGRIAIDTGAYTTGVLSALRLVGDSASFLFANGEGAQAELD